jgi:ribosomal protein S18 acetylase RimI-like enzyme
MEICVATIQEMPSVKALFVEYQNWLGVDLCFQNFDRELAELPGCYAPPQGVIVVAKVEQNIIGCCALRPRTNTEAELKRLYVKPKFRGIGSGRALFENVMARAYQIGYRSVVLDTLPTMPVARKLYTDYGFKRIDAYYHNPNSGAEYYRCELT